VLKIKVDLSLKIGQFCFKVDRKWVATRDFTSVSLRNKRRVEKLLFGSTQEALK
jgi:hypothetical protein